MKPLLLTLLSAALCSATWAPAWAAPMSKAEYQAAHEVITQQYKTDQAACSKLAGNAKDVCHQEAKGREKIGQAELEQSHEPSDKHAYAVRLAKADADFAVAKEKCDDLAGNPKDVCRKEATSRHVAAKGDAKVVEKSAEAKSDAREKMSEVRQSTDMDKRDAAYAVAKEKCDALSGDAKTTCLKTAQMNR